MTGMHRSTAAAALAALLAVGCAPSGGESLTVVSWGGAYAQAVSKGYIEPFMAETGIEVRLEDYNGGLRSVLVRSARRLRDVPAGPWREALLEIDDDWGDPATWRAVRTAGERMTLRHYLNAVDLDYRTDGSVARLLLALVLVPFWTSLLVRTTSWIVLLQT